VHETCDGDVGLRKCLEVEACNDAKVVAAAAEGVEERAVRGCICLDDVAVGEDELPLVRRSGLALGLRVLTW
jgi:hypothetical protein